MIHSKHLKNSLIIIGGIIFALLATMLVCFCKRKKRLSSALSGPLPDFSSTSTITYQRHTSFSTDLNALNALSVADHQPSAARSPAKFESIDASALPVYSNLAYEKTYGSDTLPRYNQLFNESNANLLLANNNQSSQSEQQTSSSNNDLNRVMSIASETDQILIDGAIFDKFTNDNSV